MKRIIGLCLILIVVPNIQALKTLEVQNWADSLQQAITEAETSVLAQLNQNEINQTIFSKSDLTQSDFTNLVAGVQDLQSGAYFKRGYRKPRLSINAQAILDDLAQNLITIQKTWFPSGVLVRRSTQQKLEANRSELISKFFDRAKTIIQSFGAQPEQVTAQFISAEPITSADIAEEEEVSSIPFHEEGESFKSVSPRKRTFLKIPK